MTTTETAPAKTTTPTGKRNTSKAAIRADITSIVGVVVAILAALHPGFHLPVPVSEISTAVFAAGAAVVQLANVLGLHFSKKL